MTQDPTQSPPGATPVDRPAGLADEAATSAGPLAAKDTVSAGPVSEESSTTPASNGGVNAIFVRLAVFVSVLMTVVMVSFLGWRWYTVRTPDTAIHVQGPPTVSGALVHIVSGTDGSTIYSGILSERTGMRSAILVEQGYYKIDVELANTPLLSEQVYVPAGGILLNVATPPGKELKPTTGPAH